MGFLSLRDNGIGIFLKCVLKQKPILSEVIGIRKDKSYV